MAELVDALDSGSSRGNSVDVRVILAAKFISISFIEYPKLGRYTLKIGILKLLFLPLYLYRLENFKEMD